MKFCKFCNKKTGIESNKIFFCSDVCRKGLKNQKRKKEPLKIQCDFCHIEFLQKRKDKKCCSSQCYEKLWRLKNPEKDFIRKKSTHRKLMNKKWRILNMDKVRITKQKYKAKRRRINFKFKINEIMGNKIRSCVIKHNISWEKILDYSAEILINHLSSTLPDQITWEDYLFGDYHIDHIIPISKYNFSDYHDEEFKLCWNYRNLRIIKAKENLMKSDSLDFELVKKYNIEDLLPERHRV